jgi:hypothetical protein
MTCFPPTTTSVLGTTMARINIAQTKPKNTHMTAHTFDRLLLGSRRSGKSDSTCGA